MTADFRDFRLLLLATALLLICQFRPTIPLSRNTFHYLFVLDITQSMNTRDYHHDDLPSDRLSLSKLALRRVLGELPCGSEAGIGLFSTKNVLLLLEPLEVCKHFAALEDTIAHIDWRMAWAADSNIERGLYGGILTAKNLRAGTHLVFMTDGEQNITELHRPPLTGQLGAVDGFVIGVGGSIPSPIPKLDPDNRLIGYWKNHEAGENAADGGARDAARREFYDPEGTFLSRMRESDLRRLALQTGLEFHRLESPEQFSNLLRQDDYAEARTVETDIRWLFALASLTLVLLIWLPPIRRRGVG